MKILLVCKSKLMENLGIMYLSAVAKQAGQECKICDINEASIMAKLWRPDVIGYSIMTGDQKIFTDLNDQIFEWWPVKQKAPTVIVGGPHPTFYHEDFDINDNINIIFKGEAENEFSELLDSKNRYPNIDSIPWPDRTDFPGMKIRDFIASRGCPNNCSYCYNDRWAKMFPEIKRVRVRSPKDVVNEVASVT